MNYELMGKNIAGIRNLNYLTQEQLAEKIDVSAVFISQIETAVRKPSLETVYKISKALNTTVDSLIGNDCLQARHERIAKLLEGKNDEELSLITDVLTVLCKNIHDGKVKCEK